MLGKHLNLHYTAFAFFFLGGVCIFNPYTASLTGVLGVKRFELIHIGHSHFSFKAEPFLNDAYGEVLTDGWNSVLWL